MYFDASWENQSKTGLDKDDNKTFRLLTACNSPNRILA